MTHINRIASILGQEPSNYDSDLGIHYGCLSVNEVPIEESESLNWFVQEVMDYGDNLTAMSALEEYISSASDEDEKEALTEEFWNEWMDDESTYEYVINDTETGKPVLLVHLFYLGGGPHLLVIKSEHVTLAQECSPCVPNAGDLNGSPFEGGIPTYTLEPDVLSSAMWTLDKFQHKRTEIERKYE